MSDSPQQSGGYEYSNEPEPAGGYTRPPVPEGAPGRRPPESRVEPVTEEPTAVAGEGFRRTTRARNKAMRVERGRGFWGLATSTVLYVMVVGGMADYVDPQVRVIAHLGFWLFIGVGLGLAVARERRHDWAPRPRWPWLLAALGGAVAAELLILAVGSPAIIVGSIILLVLGAFFLMLVG
ncbi:hypothetical protein [Nocardiopsis sp. JB363]|uniref:hypothetical protein n=1 Tax=Nocardiopsis sp. JB363 TaxID=1434837 RepID=UPI00097B6708|nr:hypothetical protein [Nocardiopsis sp. JB363]SIO84818.1 hypothetical protein BQ8420_03820 [Nocardiopsis sp. JB363]